MPKTLRTITRFVVLTCFLASTPGAQQLPTPRPVSPPIPWTPLEGAWYQIQARHSGKVLDVEGGPAALHDGDPIVQWPFVGGDNQRWRFASVGNGEYLLIARHSGKALDVRGGVQDGTRVVQWSVTGAPGQRWRLLSAGDGYLRIESVQSGKVLDISGGPTATQNLAPAIIWTWLNGDNQKWKLLDASAVPAPPAGGPYVAPLPTSLGGNFTAGYTYTARPNTTPSAAPLWGFADVHTHLMSHLAFGKKAFFGEPDGPMPSALRDCSEFHGPGGIGLFGKGGSLFLGLMEGQFGHYTNGYPNFDGWPRYTSKIHQQMYVDWIRRAYEGGLRLMVSLAVQNGLLSHEFGGAGYNDAASIAEQIQAMKDFAARHADWMEVAYTPADARRIIGSNRMAMVLGVEVDSLGTATREFGNSETPPLGVYLPQLYSMGVRHIFPIHLADNALGSAAVYGNLFNVLNWHLRGSYFGVRQASTDVQYRLDQRSSEEDLVAAFYWFSGFAPPDYSVVPGGHANSRDLTPAGQSGVLQMMRLGIMVDTDHMSDAMFESTLKLAESVRYPLVGGHMAMRELGLSESESPDPHKVATEFARTGPQLQRLAALGGIVGIGMNQTHLRTFAEANGLRNDAHNTSKSFAQAYLYALQKTGGTGLAIGTDFNGLPGSLGPRFGPSALPGYDDSQTRQADMARQTNGVRYAAPLRYVTTARWNPGDALNDEQKDVFQAIALARSGHDIDSFDLNQVPPKVRSAGSQIWIRNISKGMRAARLEDLPSPNLWDQLFNFNSARVQRAAWYARTEANPGDIQDSEIRRVYGQIRPVYLMYAQMDGSNPAVTRSVAGNRDFDINIDGVAHIGMVPDLLQDLRNIGLTSDQIAPLFRSAEDYIEMWETATVRKAAIPAQ